VRCGKIAKLCYRVSASRSARVTVRIHIRDKRGKVLRVLTLRNKRPNRTYTARFRCTLPRGTYRFSVSAVDSAGRRQQRQAFNRLIVR